MPIRGGLQSAKGTTSANRESRIANRESRGWAGGDAYRRRAAAREGRDPRDRELRG
jgi:hypothetical protein